MTKKSSAGVTAETVIRLTIVKAEPVAKKAQTQNKPASGKPKALQNAILISQTSRLPEQKVLNRAEHTVPAEIKAAGGNRKTDGIERRRTGGINHEADGEEASGF